MIHDSGSGAPPQLSQSQQTPAGRAGESLQDFWARTTRFFEPLLPESNRPRPETAGNGSPHDLQAAPSKPPTTASMTGVYDPLASLKPGGMNRSRWNHPAAMAYQSAYPSPEESIDDEGEEKIHETFSEASVAEKTKAPAKRENILQAQKGDSKLFQRFLKEIASMSPEEWGVTLEELEQIITEYRKEIRPAIDSENEASALVYLQARILPDHTPSRSLDDEENDLQLARSTPSRTAKSKKSVIVDDEEDDEDEELDEYLARRRVRRTDAPLPPPAPRSRNERDEQTEETRIATDHRRESRSQEESFRPASLTQTRPKYGELTQLETSVKHAIPQGSTEEKIVPVHYSDDRRNTSSGDSTDWLYHAQAAANSLRNKLETPGGRTFANEARLRMLEMILGNRNEAVKPFSGLDKPLNDFWANQALGFSMLLDEAGNPDPKTRHVGAVFRFEEGLRELRRYCPIKIKNARLVQDIQNYGTYLPRGEDCHADETLNIYLELDNPTIRRTPQGYHTSASISYEIRDQSNNVRAKVDNSTIQDSSLSLRNDFFVHLQVRLPSDLAPGQYYLRINITDMNDESMPYAEEQIAFKVVPSITPTN